MTRKIDQRICNKFIIAAGVLMKQDWSDHPSTNSRSLMFAYGETSGRPHVGPIRDMKFDVLGMGFKPGREWSGPAEVFVEEVRGGTTKVWSDCRFWCDAAGGPLYVLSKDGDVSFSFDGQSLVVLSVGPSDPDEGADRARSRLRAAARLAPTNVEWRRMM